MFKNKKWLLGVAIVATIMAACAPAATATPAPTEAELTEAPTEEMTEVVTEAPYEGMSVSADCAAQEGSTSPIESITATDRLTVTITLCNPDPAFPSKIAFTSFGIQPAEWIQDNGGGGEGSELLEHPVGTGPYMLEEWKRGESITYKRFDDYWGDKAKAETLVFRWSPDAAGRLVELQSGTVDGIDNPSPTDFETIKSDPALQLLPREALNIFYIAMTNTFKPWDDVRVRQAIAMGIDRQRIVDTFYPPGSEVASHFTPCAIPNGCVGDAWYDFDVEAAKALLADAGFPDGFKTKLYYRDVVRGYLPEVNSVAQDIQSQLKANLNIDAEIVKMESGPFVEAAQAGSLDGLYLLGWGADYPHITNFLDVHFGKSNIQFGDPFADIYDRLGEGAQIGDPADAESVYTEANNKIRELVPMVPVAHGASGVAYLADVTGGQASPLTSERFYVSQAGDRDTFTWMQNAEPISLYCADESDGESLRACEQITEPLLDYEIGGTAVVPALATSCDPNEDLTVWTCHLRDGVKFHDGSDLDANDVVVSLDVQWDASSEFHKGNSGEFFYMANLFGLINVPAE